MIQQTDITIARNIWKVFQSSRIPLSWGIDFTKIKVLPLGTSFHVQGFKVKGNVKVEYDEGEDLYNISIAPDNHVAPIIYKGVFCDQLISLIDEAVEKTENYEERVRAEYHLPQHRVAV
jgi:hypothetical protein